VEHNVPSSRNCHPERNEEAQPTNAVEGSAVGLRWKGISQRNEPQIPRLRGYATPLGMTIQKLKHDRGN
jgi:hypothetical protein